MKTAIFPSSFDPITKGHKDIAIKASLLFDKVYVAIGDNSDKKICFQKATLSMASISFANYTNIECIIYSGLTIEFCKTQHKLYCKRIKVNQ